MAMSDHSYSPGSLQGQLDGLRRRVAALEAAHAECDARIRELHDQNTSLVQLTVASQLLAAAAERDGVLTAIEEVVVNMIGSEELAILELEGDGESLRVARLRGIDPRGTRLASAMTALRIVTKTGKPIIVRGGSRAATDRDGGLTAAIPLVAEGSVTGVVAIFRLLEQKADLDPTDHELFDVLSHQGAIALQSTAFRSLRPTVRPRRLA
jgi:hypothetical protein